METKTHETKTPRRCIVELTTKSILNFLMAGLFLRPCHIGFPAFSDLFTGIFKLARLMQKHGGEEADEQVRKDQNTK